MKSITKYLSLFLSIFCLALIFSSAVFAQQILSSYQYRLELTNATELPELEGMPVAKIPEDAQKNGVEGTLKAEMILAKEGIVKDIKITHTLPHGIAESVTEAYGSYKFKPAKRNGTPIDVKMFLEVTVSAVYDERSKNVNKPKIVEQPEAIYPAEHLADKRKDTVRVNILFNKDGTLKVLGVGSTMPKEFDEAAVEAAKKIKFEPATHKKSKQPVSMKMVVEFKFKPQ